MKLRLFCLAIAALGIMAVLIVLNPYSSSNVPRVNIGMLAERSNGEFVQRAGTPIGGRSLFNRVNRFATGNTDFPADDLSEARKNLREAIDKNETEGAVGIYRGLRDAGAPFERSEFESVLNAVSKVAWGWGPGTGERRIKMWEPLDGALNGTMFEHQVRAEVAIGRMESGQRDSAYALWEKSRPLIETNWDNLKNQTDETSMEHKRRLEQALGRFGLALVASDLPADKEQGVKAALMQLERARQSSAHRVASNTKIVAPHVKASALDIFNDSAMVNVCYCLMASGMGARRDLNPLLANEPATSLRFVQRSETGLPRAPRIAIGDIEGDGYCDLFFPGAGLWRNLDGSGRFERVDEKRGLTIRGQAGALVDLNNDGRTDALTVSAGNVSVAIQNRKGNFTVDNAASPTGAAVPEGLGFFDGDGDGFIDVYIASYEGPEMGRGTEDVVLRNLGTGKFEVATETWGFSQGNLVLCGRGVSPADYNNDGRMDVYVSNYRLDKNLLWTAVGEGKFWQCASDPVFDIRQPLNQLPQPEYTAGTHGEVGIEGYRATFNNEGRPVNRFGHTIGSVWGDIDNNGWLDLICSNLAHPRFIIDGYSDITRVYLNSGRAFTDHTINAGIRFRETNSDPLLADFDNDGNLDLSITNIYPYFTSQFFLGDGSGRFNEATWTCGAIAANGWGQAAGDFDNDGDLDWFVCDGNTGVQLFENKLIQTARPIPSNANFVQFKLIPPLRDSAANESEETGTALEMNGSCFGARVQITAGNKTYIREIAGGRGTSSFDDSVVHIGLGEFSGKVDVAISWRHNAKSTFSGLDINQRHSLTYSSEIIK